MDDNTQDLTQVEYDFYNKDHSKKYPGLTLQKAKEIGDEIGVDWDLVDLGEFYQGIKEEMEHGSEYGSVTKVHDDDYATAGRIAYAHLIEVVDYYQRLEKLEHEAKELWTKHDRKQWVKDMRAKHQDKVSF